MLAGAPMVMAAFSVLNGVPVTAEPRLLTDLLRRRWGFDGIVISDWDAVRELLPHGVAESRAAEKAVLAGIDLDLASGLSIEALPDLVRSGAGADGAHRRSGASGVPGQISPRPVGSGDRLRRKSIRAAARAKAATPEIREAAREAARRSIVLLKNEGRRSSARPAAAADRGDRGCSEGRRRHDGRLGRQGRSRRYAAVLRRTGRLAPAGLGAEVASPRVATTPARSARTSRRRRNREGVGSRGRGARRALVSDGGIDSRTRLGLPNRQQALLDRLAATGRPIVLVVLAGRPMVLVDAWPKAEAILYVFAGNDGRAGPGRRAARRSEPGPGRLPMSLPRAVGQLPFLYGDMLLTGRPPSPGDELGTLCRRDDDAVPALRLRPSYTTFTHSNLRMVEDGRAGIDGTVVAEVDVANTGDRAGREIVQLYVHDLVAATSRPMRQLKGSPWSIPPCRGETKRV